MRESTTYGPESPTSRNSSDAVADPGRRTLRKAIAGSAMGNATEWYDYGVYATTATYLTQNFFPGDLGSLGTMLGFAISFVLRPLGGMIWGPLGDRVGRKAVLATTILLMSGATALIALIPSHASIGIFAPILLILLRVVQGFSTGGEYGGAATFMAECAPDDKRGRYGSFLEFGTLGGFAAGTAVVMLCELLLTDDEMASWGWRIPFLIALPLGLVGWYLRNRLDDSPVFDEIDSQGATPDSVLSGLKDLITNYWRPILILTGMVVALNVVNYTLLTYQPTYLESTLGLSTQSTTIIILVGEVVMMACIPFFGRWSDSLGRKPMWWASLIGLFVAAVPMYWLMAQGFVWALVAFAVLGLLYLPQLATISATFPAMFPTQVRYAGFAIGYNVSTAVFGGTAPLVNDAVIHGTGWNLFPAVYMMGACVVGLVSVAFLKETAGVSLRGTSIPGEEPAPARI
ncbi:MFS transporter [Prescottella sp. R16]|uniref:MFS transporter n=1 Tax=Prescottella sp. R16 TaxID=3064529 RepID=UPI00272EE70B|nr:MFS transporter [Prescottella sp. R16]